MWYLQIKQFIYMHMPFADEGINMYMPLADQGINMHKETQQKLIKV